MEVARCERCGEAQGFAVTHKALCSSCEYEMDMDAAERDEN